ncbi:hypothetical protein Gotri_001019 [Gossypium trilobum]|uniref:Uncharacterized protein n=1 Tax=Gossypium trilobum TaxID=34281 RepID=A0A7J9FD87_9ROSI|nr:hypothetical protein [Gossypium trilobum]
MTTPEYNEWWVRRINDNTPKQSQGNNQSIEEHLGKLETEKLRKGKNKAEENLDNLKTDYNKLRLSMRTTGLGKTLEYVKRFEEKRIKPIDGKGNSKRFIHEMRL